MHYYQKGNVQWWYDYPTASWVVRTVDAEGNQIGEADYVATMEGRNSYIRSRGQSHTKPAKYYGRK